jgi:hypothetical protein
MTTGTAYLLVDVAGTECALPAVERLAGRDRPAEAEQRREVEDRHRGAREVEEAIRPWP